MNCIVVVDAWKYCEKDDLTHFPWLEKETKLFGSFLDLQLSNIKQKYNYDVIHCASGLELMDEIQTRDLVINNIIDIPTYDYYYFCGFHLGRCINNRIKILNKSNCGIIYNLSMIFPEDSYSNIIKKHSDNYFYSYRKGFECTNIKI